MTETTSPSSAAPGEGAGALLRAARQQQGLHIAALAAAIKVAPAKLEALEAGRYDELLDTTFTRALALTVCRVLKIDPAPVLAQLPGTPATGLARVDGGLNMPFRERPGRVDPATWAPWRHPVLWAGAALLVAAAAFVLVPSVPGLDRIGPAIDAAPPAVMPPSAAGLPPLLSESPAPAVADEAASAALSAVGASAAAPALAGAAPAAVSALPAASAAGGEAFSLRALQATWVQVVDGGGQTLMSRLVPAGETVALTAQPPLRVKIGNVRGTELSFRGKTVELAASRENTANLTLP
jgi:cytoskeleton protein RodZ